MAPFSANKAEGNDGNTPFTFRITLTGAAPGGFDVLYSTIDGTTHSTNDLYYDLHAIAGSTVHFTGTDGKTHDVTVNVRGDNVVEINETFQVLYEVVNVTTTVGLAGTTHLVTRTIQNDDSAVVTINDAGTEFEIGYGYYGRHLFLLSLRIIRSS